MRPPRPRHALAAIVATCCATAGLALPGSAGAVAPDPTGTSHAAHDHETARDSRVGSLVKPTAAQLDAVSRLVNASSGARVTWDRRFGTPRTIVPAPGERLSVPRSGDAETVARAWLADQRDVLGLAGADVTALRVTRDHELPGTDTRVLRFAQTFDGVPAGRGGTLSVAVTADGEVLSYTGETTRGGALLGGFALSAADALVAAAGLMAPGVQVGTPERTGTQAGHEVFARGPFAAPSYVRKVGFPTADGARAAYSVLFVKELDEAWQVVLDATTGKELYRASLVQHESAGGTVYPNYPGAPKGGEPAHVPFDATDESPRGYVDPVGLTGVGVTTFGNNANTHANWSNFIGPVDPGPRPVSPTGQFDYRFADHWGTSQCSPVSYQKDQDASSTNLFFHHNRIHDEFYRLGFTESAGNFQVDNFGKGGLPGDAIQGLVQAGAASGGAPLYTGRDNAYMLTLPDGIAPWSGMFLWEPINDAFEGPCADGDFDAGVIEHEYAHGLSNRYVGSEDNALGSHQSGAMGEGWGDWYALNHLHGEGLQDDSVVGAYVTGNAERGIRNWSYAENPTTFGDIGYDLSGPQVHADGEIWAATLWQLREALVAAYGQEAGGSIAERIVTDAMPLSPNDPSFLDERTAIMLALDNRYHARADFGDLADLVYGVFAERGMGASAVVAATEQDPTGGNDTDPVPGFDHRNPARNGVITGRVVNASTGTPVEGARVMVGVLEARTSPVAVTGPSGTFRVPATASTYPLTVQARGFGSRTFEGLTVKAGRTLSRTFSMAPNLASKANGATSVTGGAEKAMDDTEASSWRTTKNGHAVIELAKEARIREVQVSAYTSRRFQGLRSFTLQTSTDGVNWQTRPMGKDAFGYQAPRPTAPDLHYRSFTLPTPVNAGFIRFWADAPQGDTVTDVQVGEVQVFGEAQDVEPGPPPPPDAPVSESFTIAAGNPANVEAPGVTGTELETTCTLPLASQDVDGHVTVLTGEQDDGLHAFHTTSGATNVDADVYLYDADCTRLAASATEAADESGSIPSGTAYILTALYAGAAADITLTITDTQ